MNRKLVKHYIKFLNFLHKPLVQSGHADPYHAVFREFVNLTESSSSPSILEIGSRNVTGITRRQLFPNSNEYVGFDILKGEGVDVVGDVHRLSAQFTQSKFDFAYSISVFEHLLFPWKAVLEINKVLKTGGYLFVSTHPVWPTHELPWDFWRFPQNGLHALFNKYTGFEVISITEGLPSKLYSLVDDLPTQDNCYESLNQGVALIVRKTGEYREDLLKWDIEVEDVVETMYPGGG